MFNMFMENYLALNSLAKVIIFLLVGCPLVTLLRSLLEQIFNGGDVFASYVNSFLFGTSLCSSAVFIAAGIPLLAFVSTLAVVAICFLVPPLSNIDQCDIV